MDRSSIAIIGAGAVGGYYGARLAQHGHDVHFLLRSDYDAVRRRGFVVRSVEGDFALAPQSLNVYNDPRAMPRVDLVIVAIKTTDNHLYHSLIAPLLQERTEILTLQNGLGNEQHLADLFGPARILGGMAFVCINRVAPGEIHQFDHGYIRVGEFSSRDTARPARIADMFNRANVRCDVLDDLQIGRWQKLVWNIPFNGLGALLNLSTDRLIDTPAGVAEVEALMNEVIAIAAAHDIRFPPSLAQQKIAETRTMGRYRTSTQIDWETGRPMEIEAIFSRPLAAARHKAVPAPRLEALESALRELSAASCRSKI